MVWVWYARLKIFVLKKANEKMDSYTKGSLGMGGLGLACGLVGTILGSVSLANSHQTEDTLSSLQSELTHWKK